MSSFLSTQTTKVKNLHKKYAKTNQLCDKRILRTRCLCIELGSQEAPSKGLADGRGEFTGEEILRLCFEE